MRLSSEAAVIELLEDSDDDIVEVSPTPDPHQGPSREAQQKAAKNPKTARAPPETGGRTGTSISHGTSRMSSTVHPASSSSGYTSTNAGKTAQRHSAPMPIDDASSGGHSNQTVPARSRRSPSPGPSQPRSSVPAPMQIPMTSATAGSSSTPDFRQLIATMRAQGQLKPPPGYAYTSQPRDVAGLDPHAGPVGVSASDSDIEMADAHEYDRDHEMEPPPALAQEDPNDLEDMYADPVKKEEPVDAPFLHNRTSRSRGNDGTKKNNLPGWIRDYEETEEDDPWTTAFQERAERVSVRRTAGVRRPRKKQALGNRSKRESFEVIQRTAIPAEVDVIPQPPQQRWTTGMRELERLFE
ncbi:hypothetical protein EIP86_002214 [Pleurotus ostreatoroseus]|nr:hypothetical protein EIP86_002214 [Pleurotus ostreatoroseus]